MNKPLFAVLVAASLSAACSAAPPGEPSAEDTSQALCTGNRKPVTCGPCVADPGNPTRGHQTCMLCGGDEYTRTCTPPPPPPPTIDATWTGNVWLWTPHGPTQGAFSMPLVFKEIGGAWKIEVDSLTIPLGVTLTLTQGEIGTGSVQGDAATLSLPLHASASGQSFDEYVTLSTESSIAPPGATPVKGWEYAPSQSTVSMVGQTSDGFYAFFSGTINAWPQ